MKLTDKNILVVGLGRTGSAVARFLYKRNARVTVTDAADKDKLMHHVEAISDMDIRMELGCHKTESFNRSDLIVVSPGVPHTLAPIQQAMQMGIPVVGEIELASRFIQEPIIAITGTNGKTTTTSLLGELFKAAGKKVFVGGNIGNPLIEYVDMPERAEVLVVEVSSFQLDTIVTFHPQVAVLLNITADHLDRYRDFDAYVKAKGRIFANQTETDTAIFNGADPAALAAGRKTRGRQFIFCHAPQDYEKIKPDAVIGRQAIGIRNGNGEMKQIGLSGIRLLGRHNLENVAAASLAAGVFGVPASTIETALKRFRTLPHRMEPVAIRQGIHYINDSKSTNMDALLKALAAFSRPVILIMGGRNKGGDFSLLKDSIRRQAKKVIAMGESRGRIHAILGPVTPTEMAASMAEALSLATNAAVPGDTVLLSPGCASFDMYANYAERGEAFRQLVENL